eukprot:GFUD01032356.1.p1 GENE.GFUD01032356.1~~GFUD01032356.1.p1  ORF type:complete len:597 (+),score=134.77 GFUD01032356.1:52-1791(+)
MDVTLLSIIMVLAVAEGKKIENLNDECVINSNIKDLTDFLPTIHQPDRAYYICQKQKLNSRKQKNDETQFLSLYDPAQKAPIFSAAIVEKRKENLPTRTKWTVPSEDVDDGLTDEDYKVFDDFDRGHLFPRNYAKDAIQAETTKRLTNSVPQDRIFNRLLWKLSEQKLKKKYIDECNKVSTNKAIVVTGSVAAYFGESPAPELGSKIVRIGKTAQNQRSYNMIPHTKFKPEETDGEMQNKITVPTHMWTYFVCVNKESNEVVNQASYIGLNYRTGVIKWYTKLDKFLSTLTKMYHNINDIKLFNHQIEAIKLWESKLNVDVDTDSELNTDSEMDTNTDMVSDTDNDLDGDIDSDMVDDSNSVINSEEDRKNESKEDENEEEEEEKKEEEDEKTCYGTASLDVETMKCDKINVVEEDQFWDKANIFIIRKKNEKRRLNYLLRFYGMNIEITGEDYVQLDAVSSVASKDVMKPDDVDMKRRKRSTVNTEKVIQKATKITDKDPNSDFIIKECSISEIYTNGTLREEHVFNFENNILIQDKNINSGSNLNATTFIDGKATEAKKDVSKKREITIILQKRDGL